MTEDKKAKQIEKLTQRVDQVFNYLKEINKNESDTLDLITAVNTKVTDVHKRVEYLDRTLDNRVKLTILEKLDIKWQAFAVWIAIISLSLAASKWLFI